MFAMAVVRALLSTIPRKKQLVRNLFKIRAPTGAAPTGAKEYYVQRTSTCTLLQATAN